MFIDYDQIIKNITVEETEDGYRIEIKGNKELMKAVGFPERLTHFHERMQRFSGRGPHGRDWSDRWQRRQSRHGHHGPRHGWHARGRWGHHFNRDERFEEQKEEKPKRKIGDYWDDFDYV